MDQSTPYPERCTTISSQDALRVLGAGADSYAPYLQDSGELHDPVFAVPTQYGTAYHAHANAVLSATAAPERRAVYADRALRGLDAALRHTENPQLPATASSFIRDTGSINRGGNHRDFTWPPILKAWRILRDAGCTDPLLEQIAKRISDVDIMTSFKSRPPSNWATVWLSGEWIRVREGMSPNSVAQIASWLEGFFDRIDLDLGWYEEPGRPNSYDLFSRFHLTDLLAEGYDGAHADRLRQLLRTGLQRSVAVQMSDGSLPSAHRSTGQAWTDGVQVAFLTNAAALVGEADLAAAARIAAQRAFSSLARWQRDGGPFSPVHNLLSPNMRIGYEGYTADAHYANLALSFLATAVHRGFRSEEQQLDKRVPSVRVEGAPIFRAVAHAGRISVHVNAAPAPAYDGLGITDITFGAHRRLHFSSSAKSVHSGAFRNVGLGLREAPGRTKLAVVASMNHAEPQPIERNGSGLLLRAQVTDPSVEDAPAIEYTVQTAISGTGVDIVESTPGLTGYKTIVIPYLRDCGDGGITLVEQTPNGALLRHGDEVVTIAVDGAIDPILDLAYGYENRRGLCGLLRIDLSEPAEAVRYRISSE